jgi:DNA-binding NarL/FixJ family response regulator
MKGKAFRELPHPRLETPPQQRALTSFADLDRSTVPCTNDQQSARTAGCRWVCEQVSQSSVIIIENRIMIGQAWALCLEMVTGVSTVVAANVAECIEVDRSSRAAAIVHLALSDGGLRQAEQDIKCLQSAGSTVPSVILSSSDDTADIINAIDIGAMGFIPTNMPLSAAGMSIRLVMEGSIFVPATSFVAPRSAQYTEPLQQPTESQDASLECYFPPRQAAVVEAICKGKANKIIAFDLGMSESTVKVHVRSIMKKLKARNRTEVAYIANELLAGSRSPEQCDANRHLPRRS